MARKITSQVSSFTQSQPSLQGYQHFMCSTVCFSTDSTSPSKGIVEAEINDPLADEIDKRGQKQSWARQVVSAEDFVYIYICNCIYIYLCSFPFTYIYI